MIKILICFLPENYFILTSGNKPYSTMRQYSKVFKSIGRLPSDFYSELDQNAQCLSLKKGELIKTVGQHSDRLLFIEKGVVRGYLVEYQDTYWFKKENHFIFLLQQFGSHEIDKQVGIEMVEDGVLWDFTGSFVTQIQQKFPSVNFHLMNLLMDEINRIERMTSLERQRDPAMFYDYLRQESPDLFTSVSHAQLASFIGVSEKEFTHLHKSDLHIPMSSTRHRLRKK
jgi:CRP-like cAMP-binding protein